MGTLHCALENGADLHVNSVRRYDTIVLGLLKKEEEECQIAIFYFARCVRKIVLYSDVIHLGLGLGLGLDAPPACHIYSKSGTHAPIQNILGNLEPL